MKSKEIREKFLRYFEKQGHKRLASAPLIPSDPTVLLTLAGMLPFKPVFLGMESPKYSRVTTAQKCIRMNDIDEVGRTTRHHTFFEMLGNFSFGDYFKKEAINFAWDLLTNEFGLDKDKLVIAVYKDDDEAFEIWEKEIGVPKERIYRLDEENNFWAVGPTGPCGPCSEIYYDYGGGCGSKKCDPSCNCERFLEVWNLVFIQYDRKENGELIPLPNKNIDTGMGLERIARVLQGKRDNFDTDLFEPIFQMLPDKSVSSKIIADHARAITHLIADSVLPSNEGRGYVLRRLIRRATLHGRKLKIKTPFLHKFCRVIVEQMKDAYPDLGKKLLLIENKVKTEEENFEQTLGNGLKLIEDIFAKKAADKKLSAEDAFKLHDTYGFPFEVTSELALEKGFLIDKDGFDKLMEEQKERGRGNSEKSQENILRLKNVYQGKYGGTKFIGYDKLECDSKIVAVIPEEKIVILDKTPFYPEGGGQVGDTGIIQDKIVVGTYGEIGGIIIHLLDNIEGLNEGAKVKAHVDESKRQQSATHHTTTHLLHAALRKVLGDFVSQAGSYVRPDYFRFDFTFNRAMTAEEIEEVEGLVNEEIKRKLAVDKTNISYEKACEMGAMALFSEKYGDKVRVVQIKDVSCELCGGCHIKNTSEIDFFKIIKEEALQAGIRRIEAIAGEPSKIFIVYRSKNMKDQINNLMRQHLLLSAKKDLLGGGKFLEASIFDIEQTEIDSLIKAVNEKDIFKVNKFLEHLEGRLAWLKERNKKLQKEIDDLETQKALKEADLLISQARDIKEIKFLSAKLCEIPMNNLRIMADRIRNSLKSGIIILSSIISDRVLFLVVVTDDLVQKGYHAGKLAKILAETCGGGGGGKADKSEAGGKNPSKIDEAIDKVIASL